MSLNHQILGLQTQASKEEVKLAYRRLALKYHPDINPSNDAKRKFIEINKAYQYLMGSSYSAPIQEETYEEMAKRKYYEKYVDNGKKGMLFNEYIAFKAKVAWGMVFYILFTMLFSIGGVYLLLWYKGIL